MIKFVLAALWLCLATLGAVFFAATRAPGAAEAAAEPPPPLMGGLDFVKTEVIPVPVVREGAVVGYFLSRLVYTVEPGKLAKLSVPAETLLVDEVYTFLYGHDQIDFTRPEAFDIDRFRRDLRDGVNRRVGSTLVHEVMVEQIDFLSKDDIRDNTLRRRAEAARAATKKEEAGGHGASGGHGGGHGEAEHAAPSH